MVSYHRNYLKKLISSTFFLLFLFLSHSLFISVFASVVYAACIRESGIGESFTNARFTDLSLEGLGCVVAVVYRRLAEARADLH